LQQNRLKNFWSAAITITGIEIMHMIRMGQLRSTRSCVQHNSSTPSQGRKHRVHVCNQTLRNFATEPADLP